MNSSLKTLLFSLVCLSLACKTVPPAPGLETPPIEGTAPLTTPPPKPVPLIPTATQQGLPQTLPFHLEVQEASNSLRKGLQSFSFAQAGGKWLFVGGRTNGFHRTSTSSRTFPVEYANQDLIVFDPVSGQWWSRALPAAYL